MGDGAELLAFIELARYDEATNVVSVVQANRPNMVVSGDGPAPIGTAADVLEGDSITESVPAKLLQVESGWAAVVKKTSEAGAKYVFFRDDVVVTSTVMHQTTAPCMAETLRALTVIRDRAVADFRFRARVVCSDRYAAQLAAERGIATARKEWSFLHTACEIHMSTAAQAQALHLMDDSISGMIRTAVSLKLGGWMRAFRHCLVQEVLDTLDVQQGQASLEAKAFRMAAATIFGGAGVRRRVLQTVLSFLPNGDWRRRDVVQVFVDPSAVWTKQGVAKQVAKGVCWALAGRHFQIFNRKRWTGCDEAIGQLGLLEACHGLLSRTYCRFLRQQGCPGLAATLATSLAAHGPPIEIAPAVGIAPPMPALAIAEDAEGDGGEPEPEGELALIAGDIAPAADAPAPLPESAKGNVDGDPWAEENAKNRAIATRWMAGSPLRDTVLARVTMEPAMAVLRKQLAIGASGWERQQHKRTLGALGANRNISYRIVIAARGELDLQFSHHMRMLLQSNSLWSVLYDRDRTEHTRCLAYRMAAREMAEYERLLARRHRSPQFQLFLLLDNQPAALEKLCTMLRHQPCLLDSFTKSFLEKWEDPASDDARMVLLLIALEAHVDTAKIECWHSWTKRIAIKLGAQTKRPNLYDVSARHLAQKIKKKNRMFEEWVPAGPSQAPPSEEADAAGEMPEAKRRRGGGGAWRSYVSKQFREGETSFSEIAQGYKDLDDDEMAAHVAAGAEATDRHRRGQPSFGLRQRQIERAQVNNEAILFNRRHALTDRNFLEGSDIAVSPALANVAESQYSRGLRILRRAGRLASAEALALHARSDQAIADYVKNEGANTMATVKDTFPQLSESLQKCCAMPLRDRDESIAYVHTVSDASSIAASTATLLASAPNVPAHVRMGQCLDAYWAHRHRPVGADDWQGPELGGKQGGTDSACCKAGHCLCSPEGRRLKRMTDRFYAIVKEFCPADSKERELARDGFIVVRLCQQPVHRLFDDSEEEDPEDENRWWHIAKLMLKPYLPIVVDMRALDFAEDELVPLDAELRMQACFFDLCFLIP